MFVSFQHLCDLTATLNGLAVSLPGFDDSDEIRIVCVYDGSQYQAKNIRHNISGGFIYSQMYYGDDVEEVWRDVLLAALDTDEDIELEDEIEVNELRDCDDISLAELEYGSEAWNAFDRGFEV